MEDGGYLYILPGYTSSIFQDFESYLRIEFDLVEDDIKLVLDKYNSSSITYELEQCSQIFKDLSEVLLSFLRPDYPGPSNAIDNEFDDITMKTELVVRDGFIAIVFDENRFSVLSLVSSMDGNTNSIINKLARKL